MGVVGAARPCWKGHDPGIRVALRPWIPDQVRNDGKGDGRLNEPRRTLRSAQLNGGAVGEDLGSGVCYRGGGVPHGDHGVRAECFRF